MRSKGSSPGPRRWRRFLGDGRRSGSPDRCRARPGRAASRRGGRRGLYLSAGCAGGSIRRSGRATWCSATASCPSTGPGMRRPISGRLGARRRAVGPRARGLRRSDRVSPVLLRPPSVRRPIRRSSSRWKRGGRGSGAGARHPVRGGEGGARRGGRRCRLPRRQVVDGDGRDRRRPRRRGAGAPTAVVAAPCGSRGASVAGACSAAAGRGVQRRTRCARWRVARCAARSSASSSEVWRTMRYPAHIATDMMKWQLANWWHGTERVPVVLMPSRCTPATAASAARPSATRRPPEPRAAPGLLRCDRRVRCAGRLDLRRRADGLSRSSS